MLSWLWKVWFDVDNVEKGFIVRVWQGQTPVISVFQVIKKLSVQ